MAVGAVSDHPDVIPDSARVDHVNVADGALGVPEDDDLYTLRETNLGAGSPVVPSYPLA